MHTGDIERRLTFLRRAEALKSTLRSGYTATGRSESSAEHSWRLCLMALTFADQFPEINLERLLKICLLHDLGEAVNGDVPAPQQGDDGADRAAAEREAMQQLLAPLPGPLQAEMLALWDEYAAGETPEARLAKALDKLETILQHTQGQNPPDFDYAFNLDYGRAATDADPRTDAIRRPLDAATARRAEENGQ